MPDSYGLIDGSIFDNSEKEGMIGVKSGMGWRNPLTSMSGPTYVKETKMHQEGSKELFLKVKMPVQLSKIQSS